MFSHFPLHQKNLFTLLYQLCAPAQQHVPGGADAAFAGDLDLAFITGCVGFARQGLEPMLEWVDARRRL